MAISSTPTLREIITEVYGSYNSTKTFRNCQADASNKHYFTLAGRYINSMRSWQGYSQEYTITILIEFIDAIAYGFSDVDASVVINIENVSIQEDLNTWEKETTNSHNLIFKRQILSPTYSPAFYGFFIQDVTFNGNTSLIRGLIASVNPYTVEEIVYSKTDGGGFDSSVVDNNVINIEEPFITQKIGRTHV